MGVIAGPGPGSSQSGPPAIPGALRPAACPQDILEWRTARSFLYWRLRRLLLEGQVKREVLSACPELSHMHVQSMLRRWFVEAEGAVKVGLGQRCARAGGGPRAPPGRQGPLADAASTSTPGLYCAFPGAQMVENPPAGQETWVRSLGREAPLEEETATHCSIPA